MAVLIVLFASLLVYRSAGALGVEWLDSWQTATRCALSTMLFFTASAHFTRMRDDLVRTMPLWSAKNSVSLQNQQVMVSLRNIVYMVEFRSVNTEGIREFLAGTPYE